MIISCNQKQPEQQNITKTDNRTEAQLLLDKCLNYHDPENKWNTFAADIQVKTVIYRAQKDSKDTLRDERNSSISLDNGNRYFTMERTTDGFALNRKVIADSICESTWDKPKLSAEDSIMKNLTCAEAADYRNYYRYMIGIPLVLRDKGAIVKDTIFTEKVYGKDYQVITVNYQPIAKEPTWYFYIDPSTYQMVRAKFVKPTEPGKQASGEIIDLLKPVDFKGMKVFSQLYWMYLNEGRLADDFYEFSELKLN